MEIGTRLKKTARSSSGEGHSSSPPCTNYPTNNNDNNAEHTFYQENNLEPFSTDHCVPLERPPCLACLKVISLNFCSLRRLGKRAALKAMVDEHKPHIIIQVAKLT